MPQLDMTDLAIQKRIAETLKAKPFETGQVDYFDTNRHRQPGLALRLSGSRSEDGTPKVAASFVLLYRIKGNPKLKRCTIGTYPKPYSLGKARDEAGEIVQAARRGVDLVVQRREQQEAANRAQAAKERDTIEAVSKLWLADWRTRPKRKGGKRSPEYLDKLEQYLSKHILPRWRGRHLAEIRRADVDELVSEIARPSKAGGGPVVANRCLACVKAMFNWAIRREMIEANPATLVERPGVETARERVLATDELAGVSAAFNTLPYPFGHFFRLALLTAQRREEVAGMEWSELDLTAEVPTWTIPKERTKANRTHVVPLSAEALAVIEELKGYKREGVSLLFTTNGRTRISGFSRAKTLIDKTVATARKEQEMDPVAHWTVHDLRRTAATEMSRLGTTRFVVARVLNHTDSEVTGIYDRNLYLAEKKAALTQWGAYLKRLGAPKSNVASLAERRRTESVGAA
jgi:integrase